MEAELIALDRYIYAEAPIKALRWASLGQNIPDCSRKNGYSYADGNLSDNQ